jgi:DNA-binding XRE family transcriptional regulator
MDWKEAKKQLLKDQTIKREYERVDLAYEIGQMISEGRIAAKMTQSMLAQLVGTKQPSIARLEKGSYLPSLSFLQKIAEAFNTELLPPRLGMLEEKKKATAYNVKREYAYGSQERLPRVLKSREIAPPECNPPLEWSSNGNQLISGRLEYAV